MCTSKPKTPPPPPPIEEKKPDLQISGREKKDRKKTGRKSSGLSRFMITPGGSSGSGANIPQG